MKKQLKAIVVVLTVAMLMAVTALLPANINAGELEPSGPPGPTMRTLDEIYSAATWSKKITVPDGRFELVLDGAGVLDRETGLVWEQSPDTTTKNWVAACSYCYRKVVGGRKGWRLSTIEELASLVDVSVAGSPKLPSGYGDFFTNVQSFCYWSSTTAAHLPDTALSMCLSNGSVATGDKSPDHYGYVWCVRGGHGHDAY